MYECDLQGDHSSTVKLKENNIRKYNIPIILTELGEGLGISFKPETISKQIISLLPIVEFSRVTLGKMMHSGFFFLVKGPE